MSGDLVTIEVDGRRLEARKGAMLIEITDAADIYVPRFCYHRKLSIAANCRMCLVEVEKAPKPLPACATPVMDGMKVRTRSPLARQAQRSTMEFLLINHPLDCPICDQGGECELQDLAMGYGADVSRYTEAKRVVRDKNIGPLIQTDMTRCIHCTRCVRFGEEIAGVKELGATGRGEHMEIGTYIERAVASELSGNVIDLCPVGALTSKPYRYSARAWELTQHAGVAPHDSVGSNVHLHLKNNRIKRVVPRENEAINETWISDRDRFSYEGLYHAERLAAPMVRGADGWREVDWDAAFAAAAEGLSAVRRDAGPDRIGGLAAPGATVEALYLFQKLLGALGSANIDHRLRQVDLSDQDVAPLFPWLGQAIADLERLDGALLIGADVRREQPLLNHRLRKAALRGARLAVVNPIDFDFNWPIAEKSIAGPAGMLASLARIAVAAGVKADCLAGLAPAPAEGRIAALLSSAGRATVLLGNIAAAHPHAATLRGLAGEIARASGARFGYLGEAADSAGAALAGVLPHRGPFGASRSPAGLDAGAMLKADLHGFLLLGVEPEIDCADGAAALGALSRARCVVSLSAYRTAVMDRYAHVLLPIGQFGEIAGTLVNAEGAWQGFEACVRPAGEARPAWKVLRVLANHLALPGFEQQTPAEVLAELRRLDRGAAPDNDGHWRLPARLPAIEAAGLFRLGGFPPFAVDPLVRRARALQASAAAGGEALHVHPEIAAGLGAADGETLELTQDGQSLQLSLSVDARIAPGCVWVNGARALAGFGPAFGEVRLRRL
jgi:NADH-quinone oxidoreductase subunit G